MGSRQAGWNTTRLQGLRVALVLAALGGGTLLGTALARAQEEGSDEPSAPAEAPSDAAAQPPSNISAQSRSLRGSASANDAEPAPEGDVSEPAPKPASSVNLLAQKGREPLPGIDPNTPKVCTGLPTGADKSGVTSKSISIPQGAGKIAGMGESFSAQLSNGIATFSVPFALSAARGGAQPSLGLSYSSGGGAGPAGMGWSFGVPFIARETDRGTPNYANHSGFDANQDRFVFNGGQELVPICVVESGAACSGALPGEAMPVWSTGWMYFRARVEGSFLRFFWSEDGRTWRVQDKSGVQMELGVPLDGSNYEDALEVDPDQPTSIYRWNLVRQYDTYGNVNVANGVTPHNVVVYRYFQDGQTAYLSDIYDTTPAADPTSTQFDGFAHHTKLQYALRPDPTVSYRSGWPMEQRLRLRSVSVWSKPFATGGSVVSSKRRLVRRYHLEYDPDYHASLLSRVQVEGRCAGAESAAPEEPSLPTVVSTGDLRPTCGTLPPMEFGYSHVEGYDTQGSPWPAPLTGYEAIDARIRAIAGSPPHSLDEELTGLFDINSDGLPDVLVTAPGIYGDGHGVFMNGPRGAADTFGEAEIMGIQGVLGANATTIKLSNLNLTPLDLDGDATIDLLHMPAVKTYSTYTPRRSGTKWQWVGREITTASQQNAAVDFGKDTLDIQVLDANFDGLVDLVRTTGTEVQTFFALGRYAKGDGQFGDASWTGATVANISNEPVRTCVPWSASPVRFSDPDIKLGDMNGDGITDIVRLRRGQIIYWPGRGNGFWGTGRRDDCKAGTFGEKRHLTMDSAPYYSDIEGTTLRLDDVNGDGLDDLVQVRFGAVDVWLNVDGTSWTDRAILEGTPASPSYANRTALVDVNGSGTRDIFWGDGRDYKYIDLQGGARPGILTSVRNGLGKTTSIEYSTSTAEMLAVESLPACPGADDTASLSQDVWGYRWCSKMPSVTHVVKRVTESDGINSGYVTEYAYRDPVFEGRQREFRGFRHAKATRVGDANSPTDVTETTFLLGECVDPNLSDGDHCAPEYRWLDNPREALKGLPVVTEKKDLSGTVLSTALNIYTLRELYTGLDGRRVMHAVQTSSESYAYDTSRPATGASSPPPLRTVAFSNLNPAADVRAENPLLPPPPVDTSFLVRDARGFAHTKSASMVDEFGNQTEAVAYGCVSGDACAAPGGGDIDETIRSITNPSRVTGDVTGWLWRTENSYVVGANGQARKETRTHYDVHGAPVASYATLGDSGAVVRWVSGSTFSSSNPYPNGEILVSASLYDTHDLGVLVKEVGAESRCRTVDYDPLYFTLPTAETIFAGPSGDANGGAVDACSGAALTSRVEEYDRGLGAIALATNLQGQPSKIEYDEFGRLVSAFAANPEPGSCPLDAGSSPAARLSPLPSVVVSYDLATAARPWSIISTQTQDGTTITSPDYMLAHAFVDGMGRTRATLSEADVTSGPGGGNDGGSWVMSGLVDFDAKGAARRKYIEYFTNEGPSQITLPVSPPTRYGSQRYDAFGRQVQTYDVDGTVTLQSVYHPLCTELYDAADLSPGPHQGTFASTCTDGHGRTILTTERAHAGGAIEARHIVTSYLASGEPSVITRVRGDPTNTNPADRVVRWMRYDTLGRMVLNAEPHTSVNFRLPTGAEPEPDQDSMRAWRYVYNHAGDLVGTSDARGCGVDFTYDTAGRLLGEDYWPCEPHHPAHTAAPEVTYVFDARPAGAPAGSDCAAYDIGRPVATYDRASASFTAYDGRGRVVKSSTQIAKPDAPAEATLAERYAPRIYTQEFAFDAADREVSTSTGARQQNLLGSGQQSVVTTEYSSRGTVKKVDSSYGPLVADIHRTADGLLTKVAYGNETTPVATTETSYDDRRRLRHVMTYRGPPAAWTSSQPSYIPAPAYYPDLSSATTFQLLLQDEELTYDVVGNPTEIRDYRIPEEWPDTAKPVTRKIQYDDLYRAKRIDYEYTSGSDTWESPFRAELDEAAASSGSEGGPRAADPRRALPSPHVAFDKRVEWQTWNYDWLGNNVDTRDDADGFYDRSLGTIENDTASGKPYQLKHAALSTSRADSRDGELSTHYDAAGNLTRMDLVRQGTCLGGDCSQRFAYEWDEVGRLMRARRWDLPQAQVGDPTAPLPDEDPDPAKRVKAAADLRYAYDAGDQRVLKTAVDSEDRQSHTVYVFASLELRRADWKEQDGVFDYELTEWTEVPYLFAHGVRLGRVVWHETPSTSGLGMPELDDGVAPGQHVLLELGDHLGSTNVVLDLATGELVERSSFYAYGSTESDYRPERWRGFREDYRFTGKEEDVEVGLQYFGKRYLNPLLGRWVSADPLTVHALDADLNSYAYVSGRILRAIDPVGLQAEDKATPSPGTPQAEQAQSDFFSRTHAGRERMQRKADVGVEGGGSGKAPARAESQPAPELPPNLRGKTREELERIAAKGEGKCSGGVCTGGGKLTEGYDPETTAHAIVGTITDQEAPVAGGSALGSVGGGNPEAEGSTFQQRLMTTWRGVMAAFDSASGQVIGALKKGLHAISSIGHGGGVMRMGVKSAVKEVQWTAHGGKHVASSKAPWEEVVAGTKSGPAKYLPGTNVEALERRVWAEGTQVTNGKPWKVMEFGEDIGASSGKGSRWMRVEESGGTIHGHPISKKEFQKLTR